MTYEEAKKEAIERLKTYHAVFCANDDPNYGNEIIKALEQPLTRDWKDTIDERIARDSEFKEALEQPAQDDILEEQRNTIEALNMCIGGEGSTTTENITRIGRLEAEIERLKQPAQEPVIESNCYGDGNVYRGLRSEDSKVKTYHVKTHPHQWQGLTDDEVEKLAYKHEFSIVNYGRAIEQALKEKNHG